MSRQIPLSGRLGKGKYALVDNGDYVWAMQWVWHLTRKGYVRHTERLPSGQIKGTRLHRALAQRWGWTLGHLTIDHVNHDRLDNRRQNLRAISSAQNTQHRRGPNANNRSGYLGVHFHRASQRWRAKITVNGQRVNIGTYETPEKAARARDAAAKHFLGELAFLNFPNESPAPFSLKAIWVTNTSGYRGVSWHKHNRKWCATISRHGKNRTLGYFDNPIQAARAYDKAAREQCGQGARLNFPDLGEPVIA